MLSRRKADAAVEITALAAGAGPPAKSMPTRRIRRGLCGDREAEAEGDIRNSRRVTVVHPFDSARGRAAKRYRSPEAIEISKELRRHHAPSWPTCIHPNQVRPSACTGTTLTSGSRGHKSFHLNRAVRSSGEGHSLGRLGLVARDLRGGDLRAIAEQGFLGFRRRETGFPLRGDSIIGIVNGDRQWGSSRIPPGRDALEPCSASFVQ